MDPAPGSRYEPTRAPALLTARDAAARLGVNERTIRRAIARGDLPAVKLAGVFQISAAELEHFQAEHFRSRGVAALDPGPGQQRSAAVGQQDQPKAGRLSEQPGAWRGSLPTPLTSLVAREREIATLTRALTGSDRLLTLTGPGGVGKTRLALAAAAAVAGDFADGICFVALGAIGDPQLVAQTIAQVLGVREAGEEPIADRLAWALRDRSFLLVLDNFEQVVQAAPFVADLLAACPHVKMLVTSRVRLRVSGEREHRVGPLRLAAPDNLAFAGGMNWSDAVQLFVERARVVREDLAFTGDQMTVAERICQRLDGLPLAIELAAARVNVLSPADMLIRLERRLPLLTGGPRDAPARLRTMRDAIAWSYDLLTDAEQTLFRRLAVFVGGFTLEAAGAVGGERDSAPLLSTLDLVAALIEKSLLQSDVVASGTTRYAMFETIREFGLEQLEERGETDIVRECHAEWYLAFAMDIGPRAKQPGATTWIETLEQELPNLRAALTWFLSRGDGETLVRMAGALWPFWHEHTYFREGHYWLNVALELGGDAPAVDRIRALTGAGTLAWYQTQIGQALTWHEQALAIAREVGDLTAEAFALINLSGPAMEFGDYDLARTRLEAGLAAARAVGETEAASLALHNLGCLAWLQGEFSTSQQRAEEALALAHAGGWDWLIPSILVNHGLATADLGDVDRAATLLREGLALGSARGNLWDVSTALEGLARLHAGMGKARQAATLFGTVAALRDEIGIPQSHTDRAYYEPFVVRLREDLGADTFTAAWSDGHSMPWQVALASLLASSGEPEALADQSRHVATSRFALTQREYDVLRLLATGESNREISEHLFISPATVASHVAHIFSKLGVDTRSKATNVAHRHDLV